MLLTHSFTYAELNQVEDCQRDFTLTSQAEVDAFSCTEVNGSLTISGSDITNLTSLALLKSISGSLQITDNPNLETLDLPALETNGGRLSISNNGKLTSISGFNNLFRAGSIHIGSSPKLGSISGFDSLVQVDVGLGGSEFAIGQNDALTELLGFMPLERRQIFVSLTTQSFWCCMLLPL